MANKQRKLKPDILGTGIASGAAKLLGTAQQRIDAAVARATGGVIRKTKKK